MEAPNGTPMSDRTGEARRVLLEMPGGRRRAITWDHPSAVAKYLKRGYVAVNPDYTDADDDKNVVIIQAADSNVKVQPARMTGGKGGV